ncbi:tRNA-dihydrouridine(20) synthase [NAD(P)+]-like [Kappamyces sp. JEL0829]|nr:tRNA-dihydrouridine(20) synthase [NAD(P)+]-like [Kappamyces sp. JEL0829]
MPDYRNLRILAPMVRVGTLPMRLLALRYGADLVYSPELIAKKLSKARRVVNDILGTIDFMDDRDNGGVVLRVHPEEQARLIVQLGASDVESAAKVVAQDVAGIDLNCGCPKKFSVHDGSGSALLETPDTLLAILRALLDAVSIPVTCKIRLLPPKNGQTMIERTSSLLQAIEKTGVHAIAIHCRFPSEKPREPGHWEVFDTLAKCVSVPVIANGDLWSLDHINQLTASHGSLVSSFMFARAAMWNVSMFRKEGPLPVQDIMKEYFLLAVEKDMLYNNLKYTILQMKMECSEKERIAFHNRIFRCRKVEDLADLLDVRQDFDAIREALEHRRASASRSDMEEWPLHKKAKLGL